MFEQVLLENQGRTRKPWTVCVSFLLQLFLVGVIVMIPLIFTDGLPRAQLAGVFLAPSPPPPPPPPPPAGGPIVKPKTRVVREYTGDRLLAPVKVPDRIAIITDEPVAVADSGSRFGVPGGIDGGVPNGVINGVLNSATQLHAAPPPPPPVVEVKEPPKPKQPMRITVGGNVQEAKIVNKVIPVYPLLARQARIQGTVHLTGIIARDGTIQQLQVVSGHPLLVPAALDAVRQWRYKPTLLNGEVVEVIAPISVTFILNN